MIKLDHTYSSWVNTNDPNHPGGAAINTSSEEEEDGTPILANLVNDSRGWKEALIIEALGAFIVSGNVENHNASDVLNALKILTARMIDTNVTPEKILVRLLTVDGAGSGLDADLFGGKPPEYFQRASSAGFSVKLISGPETVILWSELNIDYTPDRTFAIFITAHGNFPEYVSFPYETKEDGLRVLPQRLINGQLVNGTGMRKWGTKKWGAGKVSVPGRKWGTWQWGDGQWCVARYVGGEAWGEYEPLPINIQVKEV